MSNYTANRKRKKSFPQGLNFSLKSDAGYLFPLTRWYIYVLFIHLLYFRAILWLIFMGILFLYINVVVKNFLSLLILVILRSLVNMCPWSLSLKYESVQWHGKIELGLINTSRFKLKINLQKLKILDWRDFSNV